MVLLIYITSGAAVTLLILGVYWLQPEKMEKMYYRGDQYQTALIRTIRPLIKFLAVFNQKLNIEKLDRKYKQKLILSGNPFHFIQVEFLAVKQIAAIAGALFGIVLVMGLNIHPIAPLIFGLIGYYLPNLWLNDMINRRKIALSHSLPFHMDLLTLAVEAGLTFILAMDRVVKTGESGPMRDEFEKFLQDLRLGVSLRDALEGLADRTDLYEIRSFTSALIQADKMGTPLGDVLRIQSEIRRRERFQKAEKLAQESPVKMLFPLILFIFPAVFIIILVPIMLKFMAEGM
ncbi:MAG: type II secretion system F family protein [Thermodesulfobacteriota bacterium]|nr:type II secretion system F family protein [Thermodesulfobacteriota bacterium]